MKNPHAKPGVLQRHDIGNIIAEKLNIRKREGQLIAREIIHAMVSTFVDYGQLKIMRLGTFYQSFRPGSSCSIPGVKAKDHICIRFRPSSTLRRAVAGVESKARGVLYDVSLPKRHEGAKSPPELPSDGASGHTNPVTKREAGRPGEEDLP